MHPRDEQIPTVALERRREILALPPTDPVHRELYSRMPFRTSVEVVNVSSADERTDTGAGVSVRVMTWNAARCTDVDGSARLVAESRADIVLLTEMDWGMARSGQIHTARELAARLSMGYAFAVEFLELGLGDEREKALHAGSVNEVGYHGAAILCRRPLSRARRISLEESGGWFDGSRGQRRVGGRIALCAVAAPGKAQIVLCSVHLESESDPAERSREMQILFDELDAAYPGRPVIIGGDLNTYSMSKAELDAWSSYHHRRLSDPVDHEPLFALAEARGYEWRRSNLLGVPTHHELESRARRRRMKLDWFLTRGVMPGSPEIIRAVWPRSRVRLSDHDALGASFAL